MSQLVSRRTCTVRSNENQSGKKDRPHFLTASCDSSRCTTYDTLVGTPSRNSTRSTT